MEKEPTIQNIETDKFDDSWRERLDSYKKTEEFRSNIEVLKSELDQDLPPKKPEQKIVFIFTGIPGSGKSTIAEIIAQKLYPSIILKPDWIFFEKLKGQIHDDYYKAYLYQEELAKLYLDEGYSVVMDDNNRTIKNREEVYKLARNNGAEPILINIKVDLNIALKRVTQKGGEKKSEKEKLKNLEMFKNQTKIPTYDESAMIMEIDGNDSLASIEDQLRQNLSEIGSN